jgi:cobaltochelatase CobT
VNPDVKFRFAELSDLDFMRENVDGESVLVAAMRLRSRKEARKIMIVLSDGQPACGGLRPALRHHLKRAVKEITQMGITVVGIGIQTDAVKDYYPKSVVINEVAELPGVVMGQLRQLLIE